MSGETDFAQALGSLRDELAGTRSVDQLRALGASLSALGSAVAAACERAYLDLTEHLDVA